MSIDLTKLTLRKPIPGYSGYEADNQGNIWSCASNWRGYGSRPLRQILNTYGYPSVRIYRDGRRVCRPVHFLVCVAFNGACPHGMMTRHLDDIKTNNRPDNLAWGTHLENEDDAMRNGRKATGSRHGSAKLTEKDIPVIRNRLAAGEKGSDIAKDFGVTNECVYSIKKRKVWKNVF